MGVMVTASHNGVNDNGVKLSDVDGGMIKPKWEGYATQVANADVNVLMGWIESKFSKNMNTNMNMVVHIGRDTRPHSTPLSQLTIRASVAMGATVIDHGLTTTPQLHYYVLRSNVHNVPGALLQFSSSVGYERDYMGGLVGAYGVLVGTAGATRDGTFGIGKGDSDSNSAGTKRIMYVDCACGVGGLKIPILNSMLRQCEVEGGILLPSLSSPPTNSENYSNRFAPSMVKLIPLNVPGDGPLNERCGAEFVQKQQRAPIIYTNNGIGTNHIDIDGIATAPKAVTTKMDYIASLDGDADRIVFHYRDDRGKLVLLDGDKIAVLVSSFLQEELDSLASVVPDAKEIRCGVVQTAYANGSSTNYLKVRKENRLSPWSSTIVQFCSCFHLTNT